jgi:hypothetical protein
MKNYQSKYYFSLTAEDRDSAIKNARYISSSNLLEEVKFWKESIEFFNKYLNLAEARKSLQRARLFVAALEIKCGVFVTEETT